jgi:hypothetical protein
MSNHTLANIQKLFAGSRPEVSGEPSGFGWVYACPFALATGEILVTTDDGERLMPAHRYSEGQALLLVVRGLDYQQKDEFNEFQDMPDFPIKAQRTDSKAWKQALSGLSPQNAAMPLYVAFTECMHTEDKPATYVSFIDHVSNGTIETLNGHRWSGSVKSPEILLNISKNLSAAQIKHALIHATYDLPAIKRPAMEF